MYLGCIQREWKSNESSVDEYHEMFESRVSARATEKLLGREKSRAKAVAWSDDVEGHAKNAWNDIENWRIKKVEQLDKISAPYVDDRQFKKEELETVEELSNVCSQLVWKCLHVARIGRPDILWSVTTLARAVTPFMSVSGLVLSECLQPRFVVSHPSHGEC